MRRLFPAVSAAALALASAGLIGLIVPADAVHAQDSGKKKKKKDEEAEAPKFELSKEFREAFIAAQKALEAGDTATAQAGLQTISGIAATPDEKYLAGKLTIQVGSKLSDEALQRKGVEQTLESGKATPDETKAFAAFIGERMLLAKDYAGAQQYLTRSVEAGQTQPVTQFQLAEAYFGEAIEKSGGRTIKPEFTPIASKGLGYLKNAVEAQLASGGNDAKSWARRGFQISRAAGGTTMTDWASLYLKADPSADAWNDVVRAVQTQNRNFTSEQNLDAMRLLHKVGGLNSASDYKEYVEAANAARRPTEVMAVIGEGQQKGLISSSDVYFSEQLATAKRISGEYKATLPDSIKDSRGSANASITLATADALLSNSQPAEAEEIAGIALRKGTEDPERAKMIQAMAQIDQGKFDAAQQSLSSVTGVRAPLAKLWQLYLAQKAGAAAPVTASAQPSAS